jgi:hypothetical protein
MRRSEIISSLKRPDYQSKFITRYQKAGDIANQLLRAEYNSRDVSRELVKYFKSPGDDLRTCKKLWIFLRTKLTYIAEPKSDQTAKTINRFIVDGFGDCKHYATTAVGVLNACKIPTWFVLVSQNKNNKTPGHAYACSMVNGEIIVIDPCRSSFNSECRHFYKYNIAPIKILKG